MKKLRRLSIRKEGAPWYTISRPALDERQIIEVSDELETHQWKVIKSDFQSEADELKRRFSSQIEEDRAPDVRLALALQPGAKGLFHACLPTQHQTGLSLSIDAEFFPSTDRKRLVLESGYQADWNRAAIRSAASALAEALDELPAVVGAVELWKLLTEAFRLYERAEHGDCDCELGYFWRELEGTLDGAAIVPTSSGTWRRPSEVLLLQDADEQRAIPVLEGLGLVIVHEDLRPYVFSLPRRAGIEVLNVFDIVESLEALELTETTVISDLPDDLLGNEGMALLWEELGVLLDRQMPAAQRDDACSRLGRLSIAPIGRDRLHPCEAVYRSDQETVTLFAKLSSELFFLDLNCDAVRPIAFLCPEFTTFEAVATLSGEERGQLDGATDETSLELLGWLEGRNHEFRDKKSLKSRIAGLPIFPSASGPRPLSELALPGGFEDPLGLAKLVDVRALGGRTQFLEDLGAERLTFKSYVRNHLPQALADSAIDQGKRDQAIRLLASHLGEIRDDERARVALISVPFVRCTDGEFRFSTEVYLPGEAEALLGPDVKIAELPEDYASSLRELYGWIGVVQAPRIEDVIQRIVQLTIDSPDASSVEAVEKIIGYLGTVFPESSRDLEGTDWEALREMRWLPSRQHDSIWFLPAEVFTSFRAYLFESQSPFIEMSQAVQRKAARFLDFIGVRTEPSVSQVVKHLLWSAVEG